MLFPVFGKSKVLKLRQESSFGHTDTLNFNAVYSKEPFGVEPSFDQTLKTLLKKMKNNLNVN